MLNLHHLAGVCALLHKWRVCGSQRRQWWDWRLRLPWKDCSWVSHHRPSWSGPSRQDLQNTPQNDPSPTKDTQDCPLAMLMQFYILSMLISLQKVVGSKSIGQFLLTGISAGAFGTAFNCDKVLPQSWHIRRYKWKHKSKPSLLTLKRWPAWWKPKTPMRTCAVSLTASTSSRLRWEAIFKLFLVSQFHQLSEGCDPFEWGSVAKAFWEGEFDKSCEEANAGDDAICNVFSTYYMDIETPWMIVAPLEEIEPTVHPCAPEYPENPDFWAQWREQLYGIALELSQAHEK